MIVDIDGIETMKAIQDPQVGDRFHDAYSFWVVVVHRDDNGVAVLEGHDFPHGAKAHVLSLAGFKRKYCYDSMPDKPWVRLYERGMDVRGWDRVALEKLVRA